MATTQTQVGIAAWGDRETYAVDLTTMEPGVAVDVSYSDWSGVVGAKIFKVSHEVLVSPTTRDPVEIRHLRAGDSASGNTVRVVPDTAIGGDLVGATVRLYIETIESGAGGIG